MDDNSSVVSTPTTAVSIPAMVSAIEIWPVDK